MKLLFLLAAGLTLAACDTSGADALRIPGELSQNEPAYPALVAPDTVLAGRAFTVSAFTIGGGCFRSGDTEVVLSGQAAEIRPFDLFFDPGPNGACTADIGFYPHEAAVTFGQPGRATVRAVGTAGRPGFGAPTAATPRVTVERTVVVIAP